MKVAIYTRVSTHEQTTENQKRELYTAIDRAGWTVAAQFEDAGISGAKGRDQRPALDDMLKRAHRREFDMIAAWSVDRLGRSLSDLVTILNDLQAVGVGLYLHQQALDTSTPSGRAMFQMVGVFAEFERAMIRERVCAGLARAKANGVTLGAKQKLSDEDRSTIRFRLSMGEAQSDLAAEYGVNRQTIYRIGKEKS